MDPTKPSLSSKAPHVNNGGGNEPVMEEVLVLQRGSGDGERRRDSDAREQDGVDGATAAAELISHHRGSVDKLRFHTLGYQRRTKQKVVTDFATVTKGASAGTKPRAALRQVLFSQGVSEKNLAAEERAQLDVLKQELCSFEVPGNLKWMWKEESQGTTLEKNWTDLVASHVTMVKEQKLQQEALWEFVHTELTYINKLIIIKDLVCAALNNLHQHGFLQEVTPEQLFSNLPSILEAHQLFWEEVIYPMLQEVRRTALPFDPMRLEAGCLQFHQRFSAYKHYCWEEENNLEFTRRQMESNLQFSTFVQWVETHPQSERMRLGDMQAKPHQRITKYPLLLKAVLENTPEPSEKQTLRGMISSINNFLESINDYLRLQDEQLALTISAQRVEGYEVEGINEEIDKHIREICQFDLTCPIRGVGPEVVRTLMLEENLKIRGRKDSKLEVVALLFSDVLLMTKVQKKGERLKVVRPPLALDRTYCAALRDGCSFVLVEVGELWSVTNLYIFVASTSERCSTWISSILRAQDTLRTWRETERKRQLERWRIQQLETKVVSEAKTDDMESAEQNHTLSEGETFVDDFIEDYVIPRPTNGIPASTEAEAEHQRPGDEATFIMRVPDLHSQLNNKKPKSMWKGPAVRQQALKGDEWIEMGVRRQQVDIHLEEDEKMFVSKERKVSWNQRVQSAPNLDDFTHNTAADPARYNTAAQNVFLAGEYPDVDYPMNEESSPEPPQPAQQPTPTREGPELLKVPREEVKPTRRDSDLQSMSQDTRKNSLHSEAGDKGDQSATAWGFSRNLRSPGLRRKRPVSNHHAPESRQSSQGSKLAWSASSSNSDSDYNPNVKSNSLPSGHRSETHRVLKLGSLKPNQGMFWSVNDRVSPDPQALSEPELPDLNRTRRLRKERSASIPNMNTEGSREFQGRRHSQYSQLPRPETPSPASDPSPSDQPSALEGLLERAKERGKDRDGVKRDRNLKTNNLRARYPSPSPSLTTTPSPLPSDGERDSEWEVGLMRHRALTVSQGWKEQLVDGDDDEGRDSAVSMDGVNVDWSGWCFDDDEVLDHLQPRSKGLLEDIRQSLASCDLQRYSEQEDGECSQV